MTYIDKKHFKWELNKEKLTAKMIKACHTFKITIPRSIIYKSEEYTVTEIGENAIGQQTQYVKFPKNCQILSIEKFSFKNNISIEITIPPSVQKLEYGWSIGSKFSYFRIDPKNMHFKLINGKIIIGKSDPKHDKFDVLISASADICCAVIPSYIKFFAPYCFADCKNLREIILSEDSELFSIGENAFANTSLTKIFFPSKLKELEEGWNNSMYKIKNFSVSKFNKNFCTIDNKMIVSKSNSTSNEYDVLLLISSKTKEFIVPPNIKHIRPYCFSNCKHLKTIKFSENSELLSIGKYAFSNTAIESLSLPSKLKEISDLWSENALNLMNVSLSSANSNLALIDGNLLVGKSNQSKENYDVLLFANRYIKQAIIPPFIEYIVPNCFRNCMNLKSVQISVDSKLKKIGNYAFYGSSICEIYIPTHVTTISKFCFSNCESCEKIKFAEDSELISIDESAFENSGITELKIPKNVISIGKNCFKNCNKLIQIDIPKGLKIDKVKKGTFSYSTIRKIFIPKNVKKINKFAFEKCYFLIEIEFEENSQLDLIGQRSFQYSSLKKIVIPKQTRVIQSCAFQYCNSLESVLFEKYSKIEIIEMSAFEKSGVQKITLPKSVIKIGKNAFSNTVVEYPDNIKLKKINRFSINFNSGKKFEIPENIEKFGLDWNTDISNTYISPNNKYLAIKDHFIVSKSNPNIEEYDVLVASMNCFLFDIIPSYIKHINKYCFYAASFFILFADNSQIISFGKKAFWAVQINSISLPPSLQVIEEYAFYLCEKLIDVQIPENSQLRVIKANAFKRCSIHSLYIPEFLDVIKLDSVFEVNKLLSISISPKNKNFVLIDDKMVIGKSEPNIDGYDTLIFADRSIENAVIPSYIKYIEPYCFSCSKKLKTIEFEPDSQLVSIGKYAFSQTSINKILIPKSVQNIGKNAFYSCLELEFVLLPENPFFQVINKDMFYCTKIQEITIPKYVKEIKSSCFDKCIEKINIPDDSELESIAENVIDGCIKLKEFPFNKIRKLESIKSRIYAHKSINQLVIPANIKFI